MTETPITKHSFDLEERTLEFAKRIIRLCKKLPQNSINRERGEFRPPLHLLKLLRIVRVIGDYFLAVL